MRNFKYKLFYPSIILFLVNLTGCAVGSSTSQCFTCSVAVYRSTGSGGTIFSDRWFGNESDVYSVARSYCAERGLGSASVGPRLDLKTNPSNWEYIFSCASRELPAPRSDVELQRSQTNITNFHQKATQPPEQTKPVLIDQVDRLSIDESKKKCTELGFKPSTEGHGKCVLQLSK